MGVDSRTAVTESRRIAALWAGLLLAPAAFLLNLQLGYLLVYPSCLAQSTLAVHLVHLVCLLVALGGGLIAWRAWRTEGTEWPDAAGGPPARTQFMGGLGVIVSALFALTIVAQWIPTFTLHPCQ